MKQVYLDYSATTPVDERVVKVMMGHLGVEGHFDNPASLDHGYGWAAEAAVEDARGHVAALINADPREIVWTSGATESDNLAIKGVAEHYRKKGNHIITSSIEHKAVLDSCRHLERQGFEVTYLNPGSNGIVDPEVVAAAITERTILVSMMHANNEIGVINDVEAIGEITRSNGVLLHVDAVQSVGKVELDMARMKVDLLSVSAHKVYGPMGIGALYVRRNPRVHISAQMHGGGHERGMRSGTLPTHQIAGMGEAFRISKNEMTEENRRLLKLRNQLWSGIRDIEEVHVNGDSERRIPGNLNISFSFVEGESLLMSLADIAVSSGSACTSASLNPSYVLKALGLSDKLAHSALRITVGRYTTEEDIRQCIESIRVAVAKLRALSPLWRMYKDGAERLPSKNLTPIS